MEESHPTEIRFHVETVTEFHYSTDIYYGATMNRPNTLIHQQQNRNRLFGYLVIISPPEDVTRFVNELKAEFYSKYGPYEGKYSKPHITICNFRLLEQRQDKVLSTFQNGLSEIDPFMLKINGFGSFENSNVIYLKVEETGQLTPLKKKLFHIKKKLWFKKNFYLFGIPHLTIAKKLEPAVFEAAAMDYCSRSYQNSFTVDRLKVLRYDSAERKHFDLGDLKLGD